MVAPRGSGVAQVAPERASRALVVDAGLLTRSTLAAPAPAGGRRGSPSGKMVLFSRLDLKGTPWASSRS
jgi:hypothetical protein